jgi:hypothetical protein
MQSGTYRGNPSGYRFRVRLSRKCPEIVQGQLREAALGWIGDPQAPVGANPLR